MNILDELKKWGILVIILLVAFLFINFIISIGGIANLPSDKNPITWLQWFLYYGTVWIILIIIGIKEIIEYFKN